jgi:hypothetical protein
MPELDVQVGNSHQDKGDNVTKYGQAREHDERGAQ